MAIEPEDVQPGVELPSLAVSDALRATFALYRRHFLTIVVTMGVLALPSVILPALLDFSLDQPPIERVQSTGDVAPYFVEMALTGMFGPVVHTLVFAPLHALINGATALIAANLVLGRMAGVGPSYRAAVRPLRPMVVVHLLTIILAVLLAVTCVGILAIPYVYLGLEFVTQAVMLERRGPISAFRRSWALAKGYRWRIFWCQLVTSLPGLVAFLLPFVLERWWLVGDWKGSQITSLSAFFRADAALQASWLIELGLSAIGRLFFTPLGLLMTTVLYLDLRARERPYQLPTRPLPDPVQPE